MCGNCENVKSDIGADFKFRRIVYKAAEFVWHFSVGGELLKSFADSY